MKTALHWFRRDLRISDNTALMEGASRAERVIPVFVFGDAFRTAPEVGARRTEFLLRSLESLRKNLDALGYPLVVRCGKSVEVIPALALELGAHGVFANRRPEPFAIERDRKVARALSALGVSFDVSKDAVAFEAREILTQAGNPYTVFTPYSKAWRARPTPLPVGKLSRAKTAATALRSDALPKGDSIFDKLPDAGEAAALNTLTRFLDGPVYDYAARRNHPAQEGTSNLSIHLRAGTIGVRTIYSRLATIREAGNAAQQKNCDVWLSELIWREFYQQILMNFPHVTRGAFRPEYDALEWEGTDAQFEAWCAGMTGYPIVDAAMRCLNATGMMHNRLRMIVAIFLTKDLLIDWRRGERHFMQHLIDGDAAANNGGWQWSAGCGTDAAPYFRIFNPVTQGLKFDPDGEFVRRWVPELASIEGAGVHAPWDRSELSTAALAYPQRIVLHAEQRPKCLAMYSKARKGN